MKTTSRVDGALIGEPRRVPTERPGPKGGKRDENRRQRTLALCEAALALFLDKGIEATTIDDIVQRAGIAKGSFYRYFVDKADVVDALFSPVKTALDAAFNDCHAEVETVRSQALLLQSFEKLAARLTSVFIENGDLARLYLQECRGPRNGSRKPVTDVHASIYANALRLTHTARDHGLLKSDNPEVSTFVVVGGVERLLFAFLSGENIGNLESAAATLLAVVLDGMFVRVN